MISRAALRSSLLSLSLASLSLLAAGALSATGCGRGGSSDEVTALNFQTHAVKFPLAASAHDGIDCNTCHGAFSTFKEFDCLNGCHAAAETMTQHAGVGGFGYTSAQCYACHPTGAGVNHDDFFPIGPGTKHGGLQCATCHTDPSSRKIFSCLNSPCHAQGETDGHHKDVGGYFYVSANCFGCHFRGVVR